MKYRMRLHSDGANRAASIDSIRWDGTWMVDPFNDDQAVVLRVKDKGLVIISGCAHAGIINTVNYARRSRTSERYMRSWVDFILRDPYLNPS